jgi:hypothetical protein
VPEHEEQFVLSFPLNSVLQACKRAISDSGFRLSQQSSDYLVCQEVQQFNFVWAVTIEIVLERQPDSTTGVRLFGSNSGWGPWQKNHVRGQVGSIRNNIELTLTQPSIADPGPTPESLSKELDRLADLHSKGAITDEEFNQAKRKLLG